jgi:hypothetical protein
VPLLLWLPPLLLLPLLLLLCCSLFLRLLLLLWKEGPRDQHTLMEESAQRESAIDRLGTNVPATRVWEGKAARLIRGGQSGN